jgi:D-xylose transport system substrate-binding protein
MKKRVSGIIIVLVIIICSCERKNNIRIGFLLPNLTDGRYVKDKEYFISKVTELKGTVEIADAGNDPYIQEQQARDMINNGVKVLVIIAVNQNLSASIVRMAHDRKIKVIAYERLIQHCDADYFIAYDHYSVGNLQANFAIERMPHGNYVLIGGDKSDKNAELIKQGQYKILSPLIKNGKIKILYDIFVENWSGESAYQEMKRVIALSGERIDVVLTSNDGMAAGAIQALKEEQPGYPAIVTGLDADSEACMRIEEGSQSMTVYKSFQQQAEIAANLAVNLVRKEKIPAPTSSTFNGMSEVPTILLQAKVVDQYNIKNILATAGNK